MSLKICTALASGLAAHQHEGVAAVVVEALRVIGLEAADVVGRLHPRAGIAHAMQQVPSTILRLRRADMPTKAPQHRLCIVLRHLGDRQAAQNGKAAPAFQFPMDAVDDVGEGGDRKIVAAEVEQVAAAVFRGLHCGANGVGLVGRKIGDPILPVADGGPAPGSRVIDALGQVIPHVFPPFGVMRRA
jgi:hypothetical protein